MKLTILSSLLVTSINAHLKLACNLALPFLFMQLASTGHSLLPAEGLAYNVALPFLFMQLAGRGHSLLPAEGLVNRRVDLGFVVEGVASLLPLCL